MRQDASTAGRLGLFLSLTKPRLSSLTTLSGLAGYAAGVSSFQPIEMIAVTLGIAFTAGGALSLNQYLEVESDARMKRTADRPLVKGDLPLQQALAFGLTISCTGTLLLWIFAGWLPAALAVLTILLYTLLYTPLKRHSSFCTLIGAVPGALPPLIGWSAATGQFSGPGWGLFWILFFWQMPHFFSIAYLYRDDYAAAGMRMLTVVEKSGKSAATQSLIFAGLMAIAPLAFHGIGWIPLGWSSAACLVAIPTLYLSLEFLRAPDRRPPARKLFFCSLLTLPLLLTLLVIGVQSA